MIHKKLFFGLFVSMLAFLPFGKQATDVVYAEESHSLDYLKQYSIQPEFNTVQDETEMDPFTDISRKEFLLRLLDLEGEVYQSDEEFNETIHQELTKRKPQIFSYTYVTSEEDCLKHKLKTPEQLEELKNNLAKLEIPFTGCTVPYQWRMVIVQDRGILFYNTLETHYFFYPIFVRPMNETKAIGQSQNYIFMVPDEENNKGFIVFRKIDIVHNLIHNLRESREIPYYFYPLPEIGTITTITAGLEEEQVSGKAKKHDDDPEIAKMKQEFKDNLRLLTTREKSINIFAHKEGDRGVEDGLAEQIPIQEFEQFLVMTVLVDNLRKAEKGDDAPDDKLAQEYHTIVNQIKTSQTEYYNQLEKLVSGEDFKASLAKAQKGDGTKLSEQEFAAVLNETLQGFENNKEAMVLYEQFTAQISNLLIGFYEKFETNNRELYLENNGPIDFDNPFRTVTDGYKAIGVKWITVGHDPEAVIPPNSSFIEACRSIGEATKQQIANENLDKALSTHPEHVWTASKDWAWQLVIPVSIGIIAPFALKPQLLKPLVSSSFLTSEFKYTPYDMMARLSNLYFKVFNTQIIAAGLELANNLIVPGSKESLKALKASIDEQFAKKGGSSAIQVFSELEGIANKLEKEVDPVHRSYMKKIIDALKSFLKTLMGKPTDEALAEARRELVLQAAQAAREYQGAIQAGVIKGLEQIIPLIKQDISIIKNNGSFLIAKVESAASGIASAEAQQVFKAINWSALRKQLHKWIAKGMSDQEIINKLVTLLKEYPQVFMSNWGLIRWFKQIMQSFTSELMEGETLSFKGTLWAGRKLPRMLFNRVFSFFYKIQAENYVREVTADEVRKSILIEFIEIAGTILTTELMLRSYYVNEANPQDQHKAMFSSYDFPYTKSHTAWIHRDMNERFWRNLYFGIMAKAFRFHMLEARVSSLSATILTIVKTRLGEEVAHRFDRGILTKALNNHIVDIEAREGRAIFSFLWLDGTRFWRGFREFNKNMWVANIKNTLLRFQSGLLVSYVLQMTKRGEFSWISYLGGQAVGIIVIDPLWGLFKSVPRALPKFAQKGIIYDFSYAMTAGLSTSIVSNVIQVNFLTDYIDYERKNGSNKALGKMFKDIGSQMYHAPGNVAEFTVEETKEFISHIIKALTEEEDTEKKE